MLPLWLFFAGGNLAISGDSTTTETQCLHRFPQRVATATSLVAIVFTAAVGAVTYALHGQVKPGAAALVGIPAVFGAVFGARLQQRVPTRWLSLAFAALLVGVAVDLLVTS